MNDDRPALGQQVDVYFVVAGDGLAATAMATAEALRDAILCVSGDLDKRRPRGSVVSEYPHYSKPRSGMFPQRNRIISGLSLATFVIEAPERSGALITTRLATEQNRDVLALPGPVTSRASRGCNQLIRDGAKLVQTVDDILEELGPVRQPIVTQGGHEVRVAVPARHNMPMEVSWQACTPHAT